MAIVSVKSLQITNRDSLPKVLNSPGDGESGVFISKYGRCPVAATDSSGSIYRCVSVPSNIRISSVKLWSGALGGSAAADIGVYNNTEDGGAVVDADLFGSAIAVASQVSGVEHSFESGQYSLIEREYPLWRVLGLTSDPNTTYDICITLTADAASATHIGVNVEGVV